jgi:alkylation response protein AidB-like acyl-CoA dehydrogenase
VLDSTYGQTLCEFESLLGDPEDEGPLSFSAARERDERETYPHEAIHWLSEVGAHLLQVPTKFGGRQKSLEQLLAASYAVGRRDPAVDLSFGLQMWSQLVWLAGSAEQQRQVRCLLERNAGVCLAASEATHGADLLSGECRAERKDQEYRLSGEKWPIGCATECDLALVLARTRPERTPRSLTWFMLGPDQLSHPACRRLDKVPTLGMRSSDVSGLAFSDLPVPPDRVIGEPGSGLELALLLFQLTRPLVASLSFGPGDTVVRIAARFASGRKLYHGTAVELPTVRRSLVRAWVDLMIAEIVGVIAARGAHVDPEGLNVSSLVTKIIVPNFIRQAIEESARVLGARFFMRDYYHGVFGKMYRDQSVISILEGSTDVCAQSLAAWLPLLLGRTESRSEEQLAVLCDARQPVPALPYQRLELTPRGPSLLSQALEVLVASQGDAHPAQPAACAISRYVAAQSRCLSQRVRKLGELGKGTLSRSAEMADLAYSYSRLQALAMCVAFSVSNRGARLITERPSWLWMTARRFCADLLDESHQEHELVDDLFALLQGRIERNELLSSFHTAGCEHE